MSSSDEIIEGMLALQRVLRREQRQRLLVVGIVLAGGGVLTVGAWGGGGQVWGLLFGLAMVAYLIALRMLRDIWRERSFRRHLLVRLLHDRPHLFVWIYDITVQRMPLGIHWSSNTAMIFKLTNRAEFQIRGKPQEIQLIETALREMLPQATFGYSQTRAQWYAANPELLWRDDEQDR